MLLLLLLLPHTHYTILCNGLCRSVVRCALNVLVVFNLFGQNERKKKKSIANNGSGDGGGGISSIRNSSSSSSQIVISFLYACQMMDVRYFMVYIYVRMRAHRLHTHIARPTMIFTLRAYLRHLILSRRTDTHTHTLRGTERVKRNSFRAKTRDTVEERESMYECTAVN